MSNKNYKLTTFYSGDDEIVIYVEKLPSQIRIHGMHSGGEGRKSQFSANPTNIDWESKKIADAVADAALLACIRFGFIVLGTAEARNIRKFFKGSWSRIQSEQQAAEKRRKKKEKTSKRYR